MAKTNLLESIAYRWGANENEFVASGILTTAQLLQKLISQKEDWPKWNVLDLGCGNGRVTEFLHRVFSHAQGVDVSPEMIKKAKERLPSMAECFFVNNGKDLADFENGVYDLVYSYIVLQHCPRDVVKNYMLEIHRVLREGGIFVFQLPISDDPPKDPESYQGARWWKPKEVELLGEMFSEVKLNPVDRHALHYFKK